MPPYTDDSVLKLDAEWDMMSDNVSSCEEFTNSSKAVCKVLEEWTSGTDASDGMDPMDIDVSDIFCNDLLCSNEVHHMDMNPDGLSPQSDEIMNTKNKAAFEKLAESMRRSQKSRVALSLKTCKATDGYERRKSVNEVLTSIQQSKTQIQQHFGPAASA
mmetsp:Transcript_22394/g.33095  ORF Transcript_22394/g.33095 Transcript_22394/m.33095 type:complete len:159 (-) Transcript_22394:60-536(-)